MIKVMRRIHPLFSVVVMMIFWSGARSAPQALSVSAPTPEFAKIKLLEKTRRKELSAWRPLLTSKIREVRLASIRAVSQVGALDTTSILRNAVNDKDAAIKDAALFALLQFGELDPEVLESSIRAESAVELKAKRVRLFGLATEPPTDELVAELVRAGNVTVCTQLLRAMRQRNGLADVAASPLSGQQLTQLFELNDETLNKEILRYIRQTQLPSGPWRDMIGGFCAKQKTVSVIDECILTRSNINIPSEFDGLASLQTPAWSTLVALAKSRGQNADIAGLVTQMNSALEGVKDASIPLETASFYGVIEPIEASIRQPMNPELKTLGEAFFNAIELEGVSVNDATGALGLSLSHLHCAAAALVDRHAEKLKRLRKCGAKDYSSALRDMWKVKAVAYWEQKKRERWFKAAFAKLAPRAKILALEIAETQEADFRSELLKRALSDKVPAVSGNAAKIIGRKRITGLEAEMVSAYRRTLAQREFSVVEAVIQALANLSYETGEILFTRHREDPHTGIREAAMLGLSIIEKNRLKQSSTDRLETMQLRRRTFEPPPAAALGTDEVDRSLVQLPTGRRFKIRSTKGDFEIELHPDWALFAAKKLLLLAEQKFFDGQEVTIRQDGDFTVGDPTGLGWDGKGRNVPDEVSPNEVLAGSLILDRSGRDTATSRLVITRTDRPARFGKVNLVGRVVKGMEGLNAVVEGDRLIEIRPL